MREEALITLFFFEKQPDVEKSPGENPIPMRLAVAAQSSSVRQAVSADDELGVEAIVVVAVVVVAAVVAAVVVVVVQEEAQKGLRRRNCGVSWKTQPDPTKILSDFVYGNVSPHEQRSWLNKVAPLNISFILVTDETSQV